MTTTTRSARVVLVAGLVLAAVGVITLILVGVPGFPLVPPGPIILLGAAALVAFVRWRWMPVVGLAAALFLAVGAVLAGATQAMLATPSDVGPFVGSVVQVAGLVVATVAGVVAVARAASDSAQ